MDGVPDGTSDESIWGALLEEFEWLHGQMNPRLRTTFAPVFVLFELKTIVLCLRNNAIGKGARVDALLRRSLLAEPLQQGLRAGDTIESAVVAVTDVLTTATEAFGDLQSAFAEEGLKGFERNLVRDYLQHLTAQRMHPVLNMFFRRFIDLRNMLLLYKHLRWDVEDGAAFIAGGTVEASRLHHILAHKDMTALDALVMEAGIGRTPPAASEGILETMLLRSMTKRLRKSSREYEDVGLILDYVWHLYTQARNLAVLYHGRDIETGILERELIL